MFAKWQQIIDTSRSTTRGRRAQVHVLQSGPIDTEADHVVLSFGLVAEQGSVGVRDWHHRRPPECLLSVDPYSVWSMVEQDLPKL